MTLYMIGLGLDNEKDISLKGLEAIEKCDYIYLETYTSKLNCSIEDLEKLYKKKIILANRALVESKAEEILERAKKENVAFLVIGDIFGATTHNDIRLRAIKQKIKIIYIHNASILNVIGITGLELYKFGKVISIPFENEMIKSPYDVYKQNKDMDLHTLFLLDLKPNKFMTVAQALTYLLNTEEKYKENIINKETLCIGCARLGSEKQTIISGKANDLLNADFGSPPHCLIIPGKMHFMEEEALQLWKTF